jgi:hypothetical protein
VCVIVNCSHELFKSSINPITNPNLICSDSIFLYRLKFFGLSAEIECLMRYSGPFLCAFQPIKLFEARKETKSMGEGVACDTRF